MTHRRIVGDDVKSGSRAREAEKRLRFEKKKESKKERWTAGGLDNDLNGRLDVSSLRKTPRVTRADGSHGHRGGSSLADLARARALRDET